MNPNWQVRSAAVQQARFYLQRQPLFLDTETTGLDAQAEIVEISVIDAAGEVLLDSLVRPQRPIPAEVVRVHGITNQMVAAAPRWPQVWAELEGLLRGRPVGIYNAEFDVRMLRQSHAASGLAWAPAAFADFCIMRLYARYRAQPGRFGSYRWHKLTAAGRQCGLAHSGAHRARADADLARQVLLHMAHSEL